MPHRLICLWLHTGKKTFGKGVEITEPREIEQDNQKIAVLLPRCVICEQVPLGGIREGIKIRGGFICSHCEKTIVAMDAGSSNYNQILHKIRTLIK